MVYDQKELSQILTDSEVAAVHVGQNQVLREVGVTGVNLFHVDDDMINAANNYAINLSSKVTNNLQQQIKESLADGFRLGEGNVKLTKRVQSIFQDGITVNVPAKIVDGQVVREGYNYVLANKQWSEMVARTESIRWANNGRLDGYAKSGVVEKVTVGVTADERTCTICYDQEGRVYTLDESRDVLPLHPDCRCTWIPVTKGNLNTVQTGAKRRIDNQRLLSTKEVKQTKKLLNELRKVTDIGDREILSGRVQSLINPKVEAYFAKLPKNVRLARKDYFRKWIKDPWDARGYNNLMSNERSHLVGELSKKRRLMLRVETELAKSGMTLETADPMLIDDLTATITKQFDDASNALIKKYGKDNVIRFFDEQRKVTQQLLAEIYGDEKILLNRGIGLNEDIILKIKKGKFTLIDNEFSSYSINAEAAKNFALDKEIAIAIKQDVVSDDIFSTFFTMDNEIYLLGEGAGNEIEFILLGRAREIAAKTTDYFGV